MQHIAAFNNLFGAEIFFKAEIKKVFKITVVLKASAMLIVK